MRFFVVSWALFSGCAAEVDIPDEAWSSDTGDVLLGCGDAAMRCSEPELVTE